ncbi:shematrin-like protein 1 [Sparus aurata]|uniref:shematrin-like protein 1 n=1 Tax=Sparus aurata TaxID=8175 RepID=UPI0011C0DC81|nr:shematrin-like protein 1 [Sparus aurata]XP_030253597.1 shematrin-like protein 1 [Sparus aurata]
MRMLWLSFLLIGHITCGPIGQDYRSNGADSTFMQQPFSSGYWYSGTGMSSGPGSSSPLPSLTNPSFDKATEVPAPQDAIYYSPSSYGSTNVAEGEAFSSGYSSYNSPEVAQYGVANAASPYDFGAPTGSYSGGYGGSAGVYGGGGSYGYAPAPQDEGFGSVGSQGAGEEIPEPVFSDVSDLEPVYSFSSRSNYQRGRAVFAQTRYTPGEPVAPLMPVSKSVSKTASKQRSPAKVTTKGRYH